MYIKTGPATDLLLELNIMQPCQQKDQILLPCFLHDKFSIYLYHFPWRRAGSLTNIVDRQRCVRRGQRPLLRLLHPGYSNRLWVWPINCMLHSNPINAVGSSASCQGVLKTIDIIKCKDCIRVHEDVTCRGKPVCSAIHNFCKQRDEFSSSS